MNKLFIVLEGIDGSGTSTQAELLKDYFHNKNMNAVVTAEPSYGPIGQLIRNSMNHRINFNNNKKHFDMQMAYLFAADRYDHLFNEVDGVFKLLKDNIVISTRYYFSSFAYHCSNDDDFIFVKKLNEIFPNPDLLIYIDNPIETSLNRLSKRATKEKYENYDKLLTAKENYDIILQNYPDTYLKVDGSKNPKKINSEIILFVEQMATLY
jgi:dTMP kinase